MKFEDGEERTYKGVVVCNGHHWDKRYPTFRGDFTGEILHSKDYVGPAQIEGKRILVIGGGNSGVDMACDAGRFGRSCDISLQSGYWYLPKTFFGRPLTDLPIWGSADIHSARAFEIDRRHQHRRLSPLRSAKAEP